MLKVIPGITIILLFICQPAHGQNRKLTDDELNNSTAVKMTFADTVRNCEAMDDWFKKDVKNGTVFLFLQGGIAPVTYAGDKEFENTYKIYFEDFGSIAPDYKCIVRYNINSFVYLTSLYGKKWMKEIRKDVIGLSEWKKLK